MRAKIIALVFALLFVPLAEGAPDRSFRLMETSIADIHEAMLAGTLTCHSLSLRLLAPLKMY